LSARFTAVVPIGAVGLYRRKRRRRKRRRIIDAVRCHQL
jgi:hypothetical protein